MKKYFNFSTVRLRRIIKYIISLSILPVFIGGVISALILLTNFRFFISSDYFILFLRIFAAVMISEILICFMTLFKLEKRIRRHRRFTFADIGLREFVFCRYTGDFTVGGMRHILAELAVVDFSKVKSVEFDEIKQEIAVIAPGGVRVYEDDARSLKYSFPGDRLSFEQWNYNEWGWKALNEIRIKNIFQEQRELYLSLKRAKSEFDNLPAPKPYVHKELDFVRRRKIIKKFKGER